jgi:DNA-binding MarR family transcriptional regulator
MKGSTVSVAISKMESMGFIKRVDSTSDKRATRVFLTEKGYNHSKKTKDILDRQERNLMQGIAPNDAKKAFDVLEIILEHLVTG